MPSLCAEPETPKAATHIKTGDSPLLVDIGAALRVLLLFFYILFEIVYELGLDAIKPADKR